jgi:hypothetical protein
VLVSPDFPNACNPGRLNAMEHKTLADLTRLQLCLPAVMARDGADVLFELCCAFERARMIKDPEALFQAARSWLQAAGEGQFGSVGYAVASLTEVDAAAFAVARTRACAWAQSSQPVHLVVLIATGPHGTALVNAIVDGVQRLVEDPIAFREIHATANASGMLAALDRIPLHHLRSPKTRSATADPWRQSGGSRRRPRV